MSTERFNPPLNKQIIDEAAQWFVEINEGDAGAVTREKFHAWLSLSPQHVRAYLKILPIWEEGAQLDTGANGDPAALIAWAKAANNIVPLAVPGSAEGEVDGAAQVSGLDVGTAIATPTAAPAMTAVASANAGRAPGRPLFSARRLAIAASLLIAAGGFLAWQWSLRGMYATGIGEQRLIALEDGSQIELNSRSRLKVRFTGRDRSIELIAGQALFQVAKDPTRPFVVRSGRTSVRAIGTRFDIYRKKDDTVVTVVEGKVAISPLSAPELARVSMPREQISTGRAPSESPAARIVTLVAGEQIVVAPHALPKPARANVAVATAWTQQRLVFFRTPLTEVAEEFNRYNTRQLVVKDPGLEAFHVSGTFSSTDPASLIRFLRAQPGLQVSEVGSRIEIAAQADGDSPRPPNGGAP